MTESWIMRCDKRDCFPQGSRRARTLINSMVPSGGKRTLLRIPCRHLEVAHCSMTTAVALIFPQPFVAGSPALMCSRLGDDRCHHRACAQGGPAACRADRGSQFLLEWLVLAAMQAPPVPKLGVRALWA